MEMRGFTTRNIEEIMLLHVNRDFGGVQNVNYIVTKINDI